jgi:hypothetical protein
MIRRLTPGWRLRATLAAIALPPLVHLVSLVRLGEWIESRPRPAVPDATVDDPALSEWVDRVLRKLPWPWKHTCLKRAITLHYLLHRAGRPVQLVIGVRRDEHAELAAHAWLARADEPYLERGAADLGSYQILTSFPPSPAERR